MDSSQLELFSQEKPDSKPRMPSSFLAYVKKFEKAILLIMSLVVVAVIAFSLGVEKGKRMASPESREASIDRAFRTATPAAQNPVDTQPAQQQTLEQNTTPAPAPTNAVIQQQKKETQGRFIIQIGSFLSRTNANQEASVLKKRGFSPLIISKGRYNILCVGSYPTKEAAQASLNKLQKSYQGCFIRRQ